MTAPQIDFREFRESKNEQQRRSAAQALGHAARTSGFFYLKHSGITPEQVQRMIDASRTYFALPEERKLEHRWNGKMPVMGYVPRERESLDESRPPDLKEAFNVPAPVAEGGDQAAVDRIWFGPEDPLRNIAEPFAAQCFVLGQEILSALALAVDLPETFFAAGHRPEDQTLRLLHYFPEEQSAAPRQRGAGEHSDHGTLTLLFQDEAGGLEFLDTDGEWKPLPPVEGTVLVNAGDLLTRWTGGTVRSAPHRVLTTTRHRVSLAYFLIPRNEVVLSCPSTAVLAGTPEVPTPVTAQEFLLLRSLRRSERFYRYHGSPAQAGAGMLEMKNFVAKRLGLDLAGLDRRLAEFGYVDPRSAMET